MFEDVTAMLNKYSLPYIWLIQCLEDLGVDVDRCSMSKWVHGKQLNGRAQQVHDLSVKIIEAYAEKFGDILKEIVVNG